MIYYTSDLHFDHANIIQHCNRPFKSVEEMNSTLIKNWNRKISANDTIYIVGDMFFYEKSPIEAILSSLNGQKHLIIGNHDKQWIKKFDLSLYFESVDNLKEIRDNGKKITLCHYPMMTWNNVAKGAFLVYGHIHNNKKDFFWDLLKTMDNAFNAGVDINNFEPVTFEEMVKNNIKFKK